MGAEQVKAAVAAARPVEPPPVQEPPGFEMRPNGLWWLDPVDTDRPPLHIAGPFEVVAETRDSDGATWGVLLRWRDHDGREHEWAMPRSLLAGDGADIRRVLLDRGLFVAPGRKARELLNTYLGSVRASARARAVTRTGWHDVIFVLPNRTLGETDGERVLLQTGGALDHAYQALGTLEEWQREVAALAKGNNRLIFALCAAFAAPLLEPCGAESGGFHFRGASSTGKSTALLVAGSVWGGGDMGGYLRSWRATANGLEGVAAAHCDALLCLDEMGQVPGREAGEVAYMLANGTGKSRAARDGTARQAARWRLIFLSSGEIGLAEKVAEDGRGRRLAAGQQVRVVDIPADAGAGLGMFECLHGYPSADAFAQALKAAANRCYGVAAPAFIEAVARDIERVRSAVAGFAGDFVNQHVPAGADGQVTRVAHRFGLVAAAGELAIRFGILPWPRGEAARGVARCFADWLAARGGLEPAELRDGIAQVRRFLEAHGEARFAPWGESEADGRPTVDRVGFRRRNPDGETEWYVLPEAWGSELTAGFDAKLIARQLAARGMLRPGGDGKMASLHRVPNVGKILRCYHLTAKIMEADDAD